MEILDRLSSIELYHVHRWLRSVVLPRYPDLENAVTFLITRATELMPNGRRIYMDEFISRHFQDLLVVRNGEA
jgi:hypothetical protein